MSTPKFPKAEQLQKAEWEAWKYVFDSITQLEKRVKALEVKLSAIILE